MKASRLVQTVFFAAAMTAGAGALMQAHTVYAADPPVVINTVPQNATTNGGDTITVIGSGFVPGAIVKIAGQTVLTSVDSATSLKFVSPAITVPGKYDISVINPDAQIGSMVQAISLDLPAPKIDSVIPTRGSVAGKAPVTIKGSNFSVLPPSTTSHNWSSTTKSVSNTPSNQVPVVIGAKTFLIDPNNKNTYATNNDDPTTWSYWGGFTPLPYANNPGGCTLAAANQSYGSYIYNTSTNSNVNNVKYPSQNKDMTVILGANLYTFSSYTVTSSWYQALYSDSQCKTYWTSSGDTTYYHYTAAYNANVNNLKSIGYANSSLPAMSSAYKNTDGNATNFGKIYQVGSKLYFFGNNSTYGDGNNPATPGAIFSADISSPTVWSNTGVRFQGFPAGSQMVTIGSKIYMFGGYDPTNGYRSEIYSADVSSPLSWTDTGKRLPVGLGSSSLVTIGTKMYLVGGTTANGASAVIYSADVANPSVWIDSGFRLPTALEAPATAVIGSKMYIFGGKDKPLIYSADVSYTSPNVYSPFWTTNWPTLGKDLSGAKLLFGGEQATNVKYVDANTLTAQTPPHAKGVVDVEVINNDGQSAKAPSAYEYQGGLPPTITSVTPNTGLLSGGDTVEIVGTNFYPGASVTINGTSVNASVKSPTNLSFTVPASTSIGTYAITVANIDGQSSSIEAGYTYKAPAPVVTNITPTRGPITGGTQVTVKGANFLAANSAKNNWTATGASTPYSISRHQMAVIGNKIYSFGGDGSAGIYRAPVNNPTAWETTGRELPMQLANSQLAIVGSKIYLFGGYTQSGYTNAILSADVNNPTIWTNTGKTLPSTALSDSQLLIVGAKMYLFGGRIANNQYSNAILSADTADPTAWTNTGRPLPVELASSQVTSINGKLYLFGGRTTGGAASDKIYAADATNPTAWTEQAQRLPAALSNSQLVVVGNEIYLLGGNTNTTTDKIYVSSVNNPLAWKDSGRIIPATLRDSQALLLNSKLYLFGGENVGAAVNGIYSSDVTYTSPNTYNRPWTTNWQTVSTPALTSVMFDGIYGTDVQTIDSNTVVVSTPAHAAGIVNVVYKNADGTAVTFNNAYEYQAAPTISSVTPSSGNLSGGDTVVVSGNNFRQGAKVTIGNTTVLAMNVTSNSLSFTAPAGTVGTYDITVTNTDGQSVRAANAYRYTSTPKIESITPDYGSVSGGSSLTIKGSGFIGNSTLGTKWSAVDKTMPFDPAGGVKAVVGNKIYIYNDKNIMVADTTNPTNWNLVSEKTLPVSATGGQLVVLGTKMYIFSAKSVITADTSDPTTWRDTGVTMPGDATGSTVLVVGSKLYMYGGSANLTYVYQANVSDPTIWSVATTNTGYNIQSAQGIVIDGYIYLYSPLNNTNYVLRASISNPAAVSYVSSMPYSPAYPQLIVIGDDMYLFHSSSTMKAKTTNPLAWTQVPGAIPGGRALAMPIGNKVYNYTAKTISSADVNLATPNYYNPSWTTDWVTQTPQAAGGSYFKVNIGGVQATNVQMVDSTTIKATTGAHAAGVVDVAVTNADNISATKTGGFEYIGAPTITTVAPNSASTAGGDTVIVTGTNFRPGIKGLLNNTAIDVTYVSSTSVKFTTPAFNSGWANLTLTNTDNSQAVKNSALNFIITQGAGTVSPSQGGYMTSVAVSASFPGYTNTTSGNWTQNAKTIAGGCAYGQAAVVGAKSYYFCNKLIYSADNTDLATWTNTNKTLPVDIGQGVVFAAVGGKLYLYGNNIILSADASDPTTWTNTNKTLPVTATGAQLAIVKNKMYMYTGTSILSADASDPTTWKNTGKTLPSSVTYAQLAVVADKMYLYGGNGSTQNIYTASTNDPTVWTNTGKTLPNVSNASQLIILGAKMYILGGQNSSSILVADVNDPTQWANYSSLPVTLYGSSALVVGNKAYLIGGYNGNTGAYTSIFSIDVTNADANKFMPSWKTNWSTVDGPATTSTPSVTMEGKELYKLGAINISPTNNLALGATTWTGFIMPEHAPGAVDFIVKNAFGDTVNIPKGFYYNMVYINSVSPSSGSVYGGDTITITGQNFSTNSSVTINGVAATNVKVVTPTLITAVTPPNAAGTFTVDVRDNNNSMLAANSKSYTYYSQPAITSVDPSSGPTAGGQTVSIRGSGFMNSLSNNPPKTIKSHSILPEDFGNANIIQIGSKIYAYGGSTNQRGIRVADAANPTAWEIAQTTLPANMYNQKTVQVGDKIYMYGGSGASTVILRADVSNPLVWVNTGRYLGYNMSDFQIAVIGNKMYMYGSATNPNNMILTASTLDPTTWSYAGALPFNFYGGQIYVDDKNVYLYGGMSNPQSIYRATVADPVTFTNVGSNVSQYVTHSTLAVVNGYIYIYGGDNHSTNISRAPVSNPTSWSNAGYLTYGYSNGRGQTYVDSAGRVYLYGNNSYARSISVSAPNNGATISAPASDSTGKQTPFTTTGAPYAVVGNRTYMYAANSIYYAENNDMQTWTQAAGKTLPWNVTNGKLAVVGDTMYIFGGSGKQNGIMTAQVSDPSTWVASNNLLPQNISQTATSPVIANGRIYIFHSLRPTQNTADGIISASVTDPTAWGDSGLAMPSVSRGMVSVLKNKDSITIYGAYNASANSDNAVYRADILNPTSWTLVGASNWGASVGASAVAIGGYGYIVGGQSSPSTIYSVSLNNTINYSGAINVNSNTPQPNLVLINDKLWIFSQQNIFSVDLSDQPLDTSNYNYNNSWQTNWQLNDNSFMKNALRVKIGGIEAKGVTYVSDNTITATTPAHASGQVDVSVTNADGQSTTAAKAYEYIGSPTITSISPTKGQVTGGDKVTVSGTGFRAGVMVTVGNVRVTPVLVNNTTLQFTAPAAPLGTYDITITNSDGQSAAKNAAYTYDSPITMTSVTPNKGSTTGGSELTIKGTNFQGPNSTANNWVNTEKKIPANLGGSNLAVLGDKIYIFGGDSPGGSFQNIYYANVNDPTNVINTGKRIPVAASAGAAFAVVGSKIYLLGGAGTDKSIYMADASDPTVWTNTGKFMPSDLSNQRIAVVGSKIYAYGGADRLGNNSTVVYSASLADPLTWSDTGKRLPLAMSTGAISIVGARMYMLGVGTGDKAVLSADVSDPTTWWNTGKLLPSSMPQAKFMAVGSKLYLYGGTSVLVANASDPATWIDTSIMLPASLNASSQMALIDGKMYAYGSLSTGGAYTGILSAEVQHASPNVVNFPWTTNWSTATSMSSLSDETSVTIGGALATNVKFIDSSTITATAPAHNQGTVDIDIKNMNGSVTKFPQSYEYVGPISIMSVSPNTGSTKGGDTVIVSGANFRPGATVKLGDILISATANGTGSLTFTTPPAAVGSYDLTITNPDGQSGFMANAFTYVAQPVVGNVPTIASISPTKGPRVGGTNVTITGMNFYGGKAFKKIATGTQHSCGIAANDYVYCWGNNGYGQLGNGNKNNSTTPVMVDMSGALLGKKAVNISVGSGHSCVLTADGKIYCWGYNADGRLGDGTIVDRSVPVAVNMDGALKGKSVTSIATGGWHTCAIASDSKAYCWGYNGDGALGNGSTVDSSVPVAVTISDALISKAAMSISAGDSHTCIVATDNQPYCWGSNSSGQLGNGSINSSYVPVAVDISGAMRGKFINSVSAGAGGFSTCALSSDGKAYCWGQNTFGQLGNGDTVNKLSPVAVSTAGALSGKSVSGISVGATSVCATASDGMAYCWGQNNLGQVGDATNTDKSVPTAVSASGALNGLTVSSVDVGATHACAIASDSQVYCWGGNSSGQLGDNSTNNNNAPTTTDAMPLSVLFGDVPATNVKVVSSVKITATTPAHAQGMSDVSVKNVSGQGNSLPSAFEFLGTAPTISAVSPASGYTTGGTTVTVGGTNFIPGMTVTIGGTTVNTSVVNSNQLTFITPTVVDPGAYDVIVTNPYNESATLTAAYTYSVPAPSITSISPSVGNTKGDDVVTVNGSGFRDGATVMIADTEVSSRVLNGSTLIFTTPPAQIGKYDIKVVNTDGQSATLPQAFTYVGDMPTIESITPSTSPVSGGVVAKIKGSNFLTGAIVKVGNSNIIPVQVTPTEITFVTPSQNAGLYDVSVKNPDNQSTTLANGISYVNAPSITTVTPASGKDSGGDTMTISGNNFVAGAKVKIGSLEVVPASVSPSEIILSTPAQTAGIYDVTVTNPDGQSGLKKGAYAYLTNPGGDAPKVTSIAPSTGPSSGGTSVTVNGSDIRSGAKVLIAGAVVEADSVANDGTSLTFKTPAAKAGTYSVTIWNSDGTTAQLANAFTYTATSAPTISNITPNKGNIAGGNAVTITGSDFQAGAVVMVGSRQVTSNNVTSNSITVVMPPAAPGAVTISVVNPDTQTATRNNGYTYTLSSPIITNVSPTSGSDKGGTEVTILGANFQAGTVVKFGDVSAVPTLISETKIVVTTPANVAGIYDVTVLTVDGQTATKNGAFAYVTDTAGLNPVINSVTPNRGTSLGGTTVVIKGNNFRAGAQVIIGNKVISPILVNEVSLTFVTPALAPGTYDVAVWNNDGSRATMKAAYTFVTAAPGIDSVTPSSGTVSGGDTVTISGARFQDGATVQIGNVLITPTSVNETTISFVTPAGLPGIYDVKVTNPDGQSVVKKSAYAYVTDSANAAPTISEITPNSGTAAGGTTVTVTGTNFRAGALVLLADNVLTTQIVSDTQLTFTTPVAAAGTYDLKVWNTDGAAATATGGYTFTPIPAPVISAVSPSSGTIAGGDTVTISGTDFLAGATVKIGNFNITPDNITPTAITITTPPSASGQFDVTVTNPDGQSATLAKGYTYSLPAPMIGSLSPSSGSINGGTTVNISGTNFQTGATVKFGAQSGNVVSVTPSSIRVVSPANAAGFVDLTVTNPDGQSNVKKSAYAYVTDPAGAAPTISAITPNKDLVSGGATITVTGNDFRPGARVLIAGQNVAANVISANKITFVSPAANAGTYDLTVWNNDGSKATVSGGFTYTLPAPVITSVSPNQGLEAGGDTVIITGNNFQAGARVRLGGATITPSSVTATKITFVTTANVAGLYDLTVVNPDNQIVTLAAGYAYATPPAGLDPSLDSISPAAGPVVGGTTVTLNGANFRNGAKVLIGTLQITPSQISDDGKQLTFVTPAYTTPGVYDVTVWNSDGTKDGLTQAFTYYSIAVPTLDSITPNQGSTAGGEKIKIQGTNFQAGISVKIGAADASVKVVSANELEVTTPANAAGVYDVTIKNIGGSDVTKPKSFTYIVPAPTVSSITPTSGSMEGGDIVTVTGANFQNNARVTIGSTTVNAVFSSTNTISFTTPASVPGLVDVVVTNPDGQKVTLANAFTYIDPSLTKPTITSVTPATGLVDGGTEVTVTGTNFLPNSAIKLGGVSVTATNLTSTSFKFTTAPAAAGAYDLTITNPNGDKVTRANAFTYVTQSPTITSVTPQNVNVDGGQQVTIAGDFFKDGVTLKIGNNTVNPTSVSSKAIVFTTPGMSAGTYDVTVTNPDGKSVVKAGGLVYRLAAPVIGSASPSEVDTTGGALVTLSGSGFQNGAVLKVNGKVVPATVNSALTMTFIAPANAPGEYDVEVMNPDGQSVKLVNGLNYSYPAPTITGVAPGRGLYSGGDFVTVTGSNFQSGATVRLGNEVMAANVVNSTTITFTTTAGAVGPADVTVTNPDGKSVVKFGAFQFVRNAPVLASIAPTSGPIIGGTDVTIKGMNFVTSGTTFVKFGGVNATNVLVVDSTTIRATTPPHGASSVKVEVVNPDGQASEIANGFEYVGPLVISTVTPNSGFMAGGDTVTVTGSGFRNGTSVEIGSSKIAANVTGPTTLTFVTPSNSPGTYAVKLIGPDEQTATKDGAYTYVMPPPVLTSVTPNNGPTTGGTNVTIKGLNFAPISTLNNNWSTAKTGLPSKFGDSKVAVIGSKLYLFGGYDGQTALKTIFEADVSNPNAWRNTGKTLPLGLSHSQLAVIGSKLYLFGGYTSGGMTDTILSANVSDPTTWTSTGASLPEPISSSHITQVGDNIYMFGGDTGNGLSDKIFVASASAPTSWNDTGKKLPFAITSGQIANINSRLYIFGGASSNKLNTILSADVTDPTAWTNTGKVLPTNISNSQIVTVGDNIYLLGGESLSGNLNTIFTAKVTNPTEWANTGKTLPKGLSSTQVAVIDSGVYAFGGFTDQYSDEIFSSSVLRTSPNSYNSPWTTNWTTAPADTSIYQVKFGGNLAGRVTYVDSNTLTVTTPEHVKGVVPVEVRTPDGMVASLANAFEFTEVKTDPGTNPGNPGDPGTNPGNPGTNPGTNPGNPGTNPGTNNGNTGSNNGGRPITNSNVGSSSSAPLYVATVGGGTYGGGWVNNTTNNSGAETNTSQNWGATENTTSQNATSPTGTADGKPMVLSATVGAAKIDMSGLGIDPEVLGRVAAAAVTLPFIWMALREMLHIAAYKKAFRRYQDTLSDMEAMGLSSMRGYTTFAPSDDVRSYSDIQKMYYSPMLIGTLAVTVTMLILLAMVLVGAIGAASPIWWTMVAVGVIGLLCSVIRGRLLNQADRQIERNVASDEQIIRERIMAEDEKKRSQPPVQF